MSDRFLINDRVYVPILGEGVIRAKGSVQNVVLVEFDDNPVIDLFEDRNTIPIQAFMLRQPAKKLEAAL